MRRLAPYLTTACVIAALPLSACVMAGPTPPTPTHLATGGTIEAHTLHSDALGADKRYLVYLPRGYRDGPGRFPVIYLLHGAGGDEDSWTRDGGLVQAADRLQLAAIVVMPDGDDGFYANWARPADHHRYEDYLVHDLVTHIDAMFRTIPSPDARALDGYGTGGYGALALAMRHTDLFGAAASHSGSSLPRAIFGPALRDWQEHDPAWLGPRLRDGELALYLDCGTEDAEHLDQARYLHHELTYAGIKHTFVLVPGQSDFAFWRDRIDDSLTFLVEQFARQ